MSIKTTLKLTALSTLAALAFTSHAQAEGKLTVYCSVQNVVCEKVTQAFSKKYNVDAQFVRNSTGVVLGKIKAEKENPQADFWFGGTIEPHLQAAELGLLESYRSPLQKDIMPQFKSLMDQRGNFTSVIYLMELGIGVNTKKLKELNIPTPKCYADLIKPEYKGYIQYPDPRVSGTGYSLISTFSTLWGEEKAFGIRLPDMTLATSPRVNNSPLFRQIPSAPASRTSTQSFSFSISPVKISTLTLG